MGEGTAEGVGEGTAKRPLGEGMAEGGVGESRASCRFRPTYKRGIITCSLAKFCETQMLHPILNPLNVRGLLFNRKF